jgi:hypothetical protein
MKAAELAHWSTIVGAIAAALFVLSLLARE